MPFACIHTHTTFCDGKDDIETCCRAAFRKGLVSLGFSAHAPISKKTGIQTEWNLREDRLQEYIEEVHAAKKRWEGKLPVYLGLEVDYIDKLMGPADSDYREMNLDYIIGSVHYLAPSKGELFTVDGPAEELDQGIKEGYDGDPKAAVEAYYDAEAAMIRAGGFDVLGHPDLIKKNTMAPLFNGTGGRSAGLFSEEDEFYSKKISMIAGLMAGRGVPAEVNTGGINRGKIKDCYPSLRFLKLLGEQNVPMVINADAHRAEDLDGHYDEGRQALLAAGYTETVIFEGRQNGRAVWKKVRL